MYTLFREDKHPSEYTADVQADCAGMTSYCWTLVLGQVGAAISTTTIKQSILSYGMPNAWLNSCIVFEICLALAVMMWGPLQRVFKTSAMTPYQILGGCAGFLLISVMEELRKSWIRSQELHKVQVAAAGNMS